MVIDSDVADAGGKGGLRQLTRKLGGGAPIIVLGEKIGPSTIAFFSPADADVVTKSGMMFGVGEETGEVRDALRALRDAGVSLLTLGQYLQPTPRHHPVERWVTPAEFDDWRAEALKMGFEGVASGPLVRSSYKAAEIAATDLLGRRAQGA